MKSFATAHGQTITIDAWFKSRQRPNTVGEEEYFHYKYHDYSYSGFSNFRRDVKEVRG